MSQKMPFFPKKALKMPGWQHCGIGLGAALFLSFPSVPLGTGGVVSWAVRVCDVISR